MSSVLSSLGVYLAATYDGIGQVVRPSSESLGLLHDLLVNTRLLGTHDHGALLRVNLGVQPGVADKVRDPLLRALLVHVELAREHLQDGSIDVKTCNNPSEGDHEPLT